MGSASSRVHGVCMVVGWVGASSCGQFIAKHYRGAFPKKQIAGKDFWFAAHWACMVLCVLLTIIAFITMYVYRGQQSVNTHSILGLIVSILCFLQPIAGLLRPTPDSPKRFYFNWGHWFVGNLAHILAVVNLYLAGNFRTVKDKTAYFWVLTAYGVIYLVTDFFLLKIPKEAKLATIDGNGWNLEMSAANKTEDSEAPSPAKKLADKTPKLRKFVFFGYLIACLACALLLALIVAGAGSFGVAHQ